MIELPPPLPQPRPPLLETPTEYDPQHNWDTGAMGQENWNQMPPMPWQNNNRMGNPNIPPPPRPPYPMPYQQYGGPGNDNGNFRPPGGSPMGGRGGFGGRGGGRGWANSPQNTFRPNFSPRPPRGGGSPYFMRGGGRGGPGGPGGPGVGGGPDMRGRGGFRGKFRGKNNWI